MLSVQKLNENRDRLRQLKTKRGIQKEKRDEIIEAVALTLSPAVYEGEEKTIDKQLAIMKREKQEKKLLEYQLKNNPMTVSTFLSNKYADGNFNVALRDRYDNSEERKKLGLTFDYHVYLPKNSSYDGNRVNTKYILSDPIEDQTTGDTYTYHVPVWIDSSGAVPIFKTDYGDEIDKPTSSSILWALSKLKTAVESRRFDLDADAYDTLKEWGFINDDGKIIHDIKNGVLVEKYLRSIIPEGRRAAAIAYLDRKIKEDVKHIKEEAAANNTTIDSSLVSNLVSNDDDDDESDLVSKVKSDGDLVSNDDSDVKNDGDLVVKVDDDTPILTTTRAATVAQSTKSSKKKQNNVGTTTTATNTVIPNSTNTFITSADDTIVADSDVDAPKQITLPHGNYKDLSLADIARKLNLPVYTYNQTKKGNNPATINTFHLLIPSGESSFIVYVIGLRTGRQGFSVNKAVPLMRQYESEVLRDVSKNKLTVTTIPGEVEVILNLKGFKSVLEGKSVSPKIMDFDLAKVE